MAALADFMYCDGREAFALLPVTTRVDLQMFFDTLSNELQQLTAEEVRHG